MGYDEELAGQVREIVQAIAGYEEKKMFGGVGFLINGNMACGVNKKDLIVRVGPEKYDDALSEPHTKVFDMTGKPMQGWIVVTAKGYAEPAALRGWVRLGVEFAQSLPTK